MAYNPTFTGRGTAYVAPQEGETPLQAQDKWGKTMMGLKQQEYAEDTQRYDKMLENIKVNPVNVIVAKNMDRQAAEIEKFSNKWANAYKNQRGRLTIQQEVERDTDKMAIAQFQAKLLQDQSNFVEAYKTIQEDAYKGNYDKEYFMKQWGEYERTGEAPNEGFLAPGKIDLVEPLVTLRPAGELGKVIRKSKVGNQVVGKSVYGYSDQAKKDAMESYLMHDPRALRTIGEEFKDLPEGERSKYLLDTKKPSDAILNYAWDKYGNMVGSRYESTMDVSDTVPRGSGGISLVFGSGDPNDPNSVGVMSTSINNLTLPKFHNLSTYGIYNQVAPLGGDIYKVENGTLKSTKISSPETVRVVGIGWNVPTGVGKSDLIFVEGKDEYGESVQYALPLSNYKSLVSKRVNLTNIQKPTVKEKKLIVE